MRYDPLNHHRRSTRLEGRNYAQPGMYCVTICTHERECALGKIEDGKMRLSREGEIIQPWWMEIRAHFQHVEIDSFVIMPNHIHAIVTLKPGRGEVSSPRSPQYTSTTTRKPQGDGTSPLPKWEPTLGQVIAYFKYQSTKAVNEIEGTFRAKFWQRGFYDHVIRDKADLTRTRRYILENPINWPLDDDNPQNRK